MKTKIFLLLFVTVMLVGLASADLGTYDRNTCVNIPVSLNGTSANITGILLPDGNLDAINQQFTNNGGGSFNYSFCNTHQIGVYSYGFRDDTGYASSNSFSIGTSLALCIVLLFISYGLAIWGFMARDEWILLLGGFALSALGIFFYNSGIGIYQNWITNAFAQFTSALGLIEIGGAVFKLLDF